MSKNTQLKRKEMGLCRLCGGQPEVGKTACRSCLDKEKAKLAEYRRNKIDLSLCIRCGTEPCIEGKRHCEGCEILARANNASYMRKWTKSKREASLCVGCGSCPALPNKRKCQACYDKWNLARMKNRANRKANGTCTECDLPTYKKSVRCEKHYLENKAGVNKTRANRLAAGLCVRCGKYEHTASTQRCGICTLKYIAFDLWRDKKRWADLATLYKKQNKRCIYSNRLLIIGENASIDHIVPTSKGGSDDLTNLQWVDLTVNVIKLDQSEKEFLALVSEIYNHRLLYNI